MAQLTADLLESLAANQNRDAAEDQSKEDDNPNLENGFAIAKPVHSGLSPLAAAMSDPKRSRLGNQRHVLIRKVTATALIEPHGGIRSVAQGWVAAAQQSPGRLSPLQLRPETACRRARLDETGQQDHDRDHR